MYFTNIDISGIVVAIPAPSSPPLANEGQNKFRVHLRIVKNRKKNDECTEARGNVFRVIALCHERHFMKNHSLTFIHRDKNDDADVDGISFLNCERMGQHLSTLQEPLARLSETNRLGSERIQAKRAYFIRWQSRFGNGPMSISSNKFEVKWKKLSSTRCVCRSWPILRRQCTTFKTYLQNQSNYE